MSDQLEKRVHDLEEIVGTLASWLVSAQTGFGKRDAEGIWDLIDKSRSAALDATKAEA